MIKAMDPRHIPAPAAAPPVPSPSRHLLTLIMDALQVPRPGSADEAAYLALVRHRSLAVAEACRRALAAPGDGGTPHAARYLYDAVSALPATYQPASARPAWALLAGGTGGE
jgi:hypothetical protein